MMTLADVVNAFEKGRRRYEEMMSGESEVTFVMGERYGSAEKSSENALACGDNAEYMRFLLKEKDMAGKLQLIYVDPPFYSNGKYQASVQLDSEILGKSKLIKIGAYDDQWAKGMGEYLTMLTTRLLLMKDLLAERGCIWVHLDWHVVHYVKLILDQIFGEDNFINEVIWTYKSGGSSKRSFAKKHDTLLFYSKSGEYVFKPQKEKSYNRDMKPYRFKGVEEFEDENGWYTVVNMKDVWSIDMVGRTSAERTGYATQKPEKLIERIVSACSSVGDLCADFFAGSGSFGAVCERMGRNWLMCDVGSLAFGDQIVRMVKNGAAFDVRYARSINEKRRERTKCENDSRGNEAALQEKNHLELCIKNEKLELVNYVADLSALPSCERATARKYLQKDSLSLIKFWSVDLDFDGKVHRSDAVFTNGERSFVFDLRQKEAIISVRGYDAFGNGFHSVIGE